MTNIRTFSRSNVVGDPYLWRPNANILKKTATSEGLGINKSADCDGVNDFITTYVAKRIWVAESGIWLAPLYVQCDYVE